MTKTVSPKDTPWVLLFIAPWVIWLLFFFAYPMFLAFKTSFLRVNLLVPEKARFVGVGNFLAVAGDLKFWRSLFNVLYNQVIFISLSLAVALALAVMLFEITRAGALFRTIYFLPIITSATVAMIIFDFLSSPMGPVQEILVKLGILAQAVTWKFTKWLPMPILALYNTWKWYGIQMIILLGGLASMNRSTLEASIVDGAGWWRRLFRISLPQIRPQIVFILTMNVINGLQMFTEVFLIFDLEGGLYQAGLTPVLYLYKTGFQDMEMGYAATIGLALAGIIFLATHFQLKVLGIERD